MRTKPVRWSEGMLVLPHHFQAADAYHADLVASAHEWLSPYSYGIYGVEFNRDALRSYELRVPRLQARLKDGTLVSVPENAYLHSLDLKAPMQDTSSLYVHLSLPEAIPGRRNTS